MYRMLRAQGFAGGVLAVSLLTTLSLLALEGSVLDALPLHLCGISALCALAVCFGAKGLFLDFLWYLGMPGALLALFFPAPALSRYQAVLNLSYVTTHALIVIVPLLAMAAGETPHRRFAAQMMILLQGIAVPVCKINRLLGTDFMFLSAPPANTPLEPLFLMGYHVYIVSLELLMLAVSIVMGMLLEGVLRHKEKKQK